MTLKKRLELEDKIKQILNLHLACEPKEVTDETDKYIICTPEVVGQKEAAENIVNLLETLWAL